MKPPKPRVFQRLFEQGWVNVHLDGRKGGVQLPAPFLRERHVTLNYGPDMPVPITDMRVTAKGIQATLSFGQMPAPTFIPWAAVFCITNKAGTGVLYDTDVPEELQGSMKERPMTLDEERRELGEPPAEEETPEDERPTLRERPQKPQKTLLC